MKPKVLYRVFKITGKWSLVALP